MMTTAKVTIIDRLVGAFKMWLLTRYVAFEQAQQREALEEIMEEQRAQDRAQLAEALSKMKENN
jgi:phosphopantothenate synthetase